jgi:hypothetical protein
VLPACTTKGRRPALKLWPGLHAKGRIVRLCLVAEDHRADDEGDYGEEGGQGDHYTFVEGVGATGGSAVFGAEV